MGTILQPSGVATSEPFSISKAMLKNGPDLLIRQPQFTPASLLLITTPQYANELYSFIADGSLAFSVFGAVVDVVPPGGKRDGISYLWTSQPIKLSRSNSTPLSLARSQNPHTRDYPVEPAARGRYVSKGGQNWVLNKLYLSLAFNNGAKNVRIQSASTIFETGVEGILAAREAGATEPELYGTMELDIPLNISFEDRERTPALVVLENKSMLEGEPSTMYITSKKDNIIKTINGRPASSFLEASLAASLFLEGPPPMETRFRSKDADNQKNRSVYAVLDDKSRYKVIAGGGGWGARAGMLVLDPEAEIREGAKIQFWVSTSNGKDQLDSELDFGDDQKGKMYFECVAPVQFLEELEQQESTEVALDDVFGAGSEHQFLVGHRKFDVHGESCVASVE
ncbi:hypothetical protein V1525DRAFT_384814 [Lipomyces kononenkoae]|uniref:Uncharacterized protein n=1 Tax=Lipomyces kononenkoae TaxID=34357 RepID=A0ACC3TCP3_LIPKO